MPLNPGQDNMPTDGRYRGVATTRVLDETETGLESFTALPVGPVDADQARYVGQSQQILAHPNSPAQWTDEHLFGANYEDVRYRGRSEAIHVFGEDHTPEPPEPIPACQCCLEQGRGGTEPLGDCVDNCDGGPLTYVGGTFYSEGNSGADSRVRIRRMVSENEATQASGDTVNTGLLVLTGATYGGIHATGINVTHHHDQTRIFLTHNNVSHLTANAIRIRFKLLATNQYEGSDGGLDLPVPYRVFIGAWGASTPTYDTAVTDIAFGQLIPEVANVTNGFSPIVNSALIDIILPMPADPTRIQFGIAFGVPTLLEGARNNGDTSLPITATFPPYPADPNHYTHGVSLHMQPASNTHYQTNNDYYEVGWMEGGTWVGGGGGGGGGTFLSSQGFANRTNAYGVTKLEGQSTILNGPQFRFTMSGSSDWARSAGSGDVTSLGIVGDYQDTRAMITHTAPSGATYAKLKAQIRGSYSLAGPIVGDKPDPPPIGFAIREGTWGTALPNHSDVGAIAASGVTYQVTEAIDPTVSESYSYSYLAGTAEIEAILPVVGGLVQFVMEVDQLQATFLGERATSPFTGYDAEILNRYPNVTPDATQNWIYAASVYWSPWGNTNMTGNRGYVLEFYSGSVGGGGTEQCNDCAECEDPNNPGFPIPDFTPGYMPIFRKQIGDPTTNLDSFICTLESAAMVLDWHTRGAVQVWGGELIPWVPGGEGGIYGSGASLSDARAAWAHYGQTLSVRSGQTWNDLLQCLSDGRAVILQGDYEEFNLAERCQDSFLGDHAIAVFPYSSGTKILCGDPLCNGYRGIEASTLKDYAENFGRAVFGTSSPQPILFAVSRPWTP